MADEKPLAKPVKKIVFTITDAGRSEKKATYITMKRNGMRISLYPPKTMFAPDTNFDELIGTEITLTAADPIFSVLEHYEKLKPRKPETPEDIEKKIAALQAKHDQMVKNPNAGTAAS